MVLPYLGLVVAQVLFWKLLFLVLFVASCSVAMATITPSTPRVLSPIAGDACALGFDFGTSGVRCAIVDAAGKVIASPPVRLVLHFEHAHLMPVCQAVSTR